MPSDRRGKSIGDSANVRRPLHPGRLYRQIVMLWRLVKYHRDPTGRSCAKRVLSGSVGVAACRKNRHAEGRVV